ncbi:unnamed protein product, partial [Rotaria sp. Silwood1]
LAFTAIILFAFCKTDENYWYIHSLWHIFIGSSILFFLPHNNFYKREPARQRIRADGQNTNINTDSPFIGTVNQVIALPIDNTSLSSSNTDSSKKSTDDLLH